MKEFLELERFFFKPSGIILANLTLYSEVTEPLEQNDLSTLTGSSQKTMISALSEEQFHRSWQGR